MLVVVFVVIAGAFHVQFRNWNLSEEEVKKDGGAGTGGFMPFKFSGLMSGAATCFYGNVRFQVYVHRLFMVVF